MTTDIIIPQYNCADFTVDLLKSIKRHTEDYRIILVDNGSEAEELLKAQKALRGMPHRTLKNKENLGFVKAVNRGIRLSDSPFFVIQNNDTLVEDGWLEKMLDVFSHEPRAGLVGPTTIWADSWQNRDTIKATRRVLPSGYQRVGGMLAFFCVVIRRGVVDKIGYLSEEYGLGFGDDDDYCERAKKAGFELYCHYDVTVPHYFRTTFKKYVPDWEKSQKENVALFLSKWRGAPPRNLPLPGRPKPILPNTTRAPIHVTPYGVNRKGKKHGV